MSGTSDGTEVREDAAVRMHRSEEGYPKEETGRKIPWIAYSRQRNPLYGNLVQSNILCNKKKKNHIVMSILHHFLRFTKTH